MFEGGLRKEIWEKIGIMRLPIVAEVYDAIMTVERELASSRPSQS